MRIAICDDEESFRTQLVTLMEEYIRTHDNQTISYTIFSCAEDLLSAVTIQGSFDTYILDIVMPDANGIDIGMKLRNNNDNGIIIYLTSSKEFAIDSYDVKASGYLLKPINPQKLFAALDDACITVAGKAQESIIVKTKSDLVRLPIDSIMYAELCKRIIVYHLTDGETIESTYLRVPFSDATKELLADKRFVLCSSGIVVNLSHIIRIANDEVLFSGNHSAYFSKKACQTVRSLWTDFWFNKE